MTTFLDKSPNTREPFNPDRFEARSRAAQAIAVHFGAPVTNGLRETAQGGSSTSLHLKSSGGLAFDFGGPDADKERRLCEWAASHPELFQEVMHHDKVRLAHLEVKKHAFHLPCRMQMPLLRILEAQLRVEDLQL